MTNKKPAIVYIIKCKNPNVKGCYVGSTLNFQTRKYSHTNCAIHSKKPLYEYIRMNGGFNNFKMVPLAFVVNWTNSSEYREIEKKFIEMYKPFYNKNVPNRTAKEWKEINKDRQRIYNYRHRNKNGDALKERCKKYNLENREKRKKKVIEYYKKNKEKIKERNNYKIMCLCGNKINRSHLKFGTHKCFKTHHINALQNIKIAKIKLKSNPLNINPLV